jgi:hypothetical protein
MYVSLTKALLEYVYDIDDRISKFLSQISETLNHIQMDQNG